MSKYPLALGSKGRPQVVARVAALISRTAVTDLQKCDRAGCAIHKLMGRALRGKSDAHPGCKVRLAFLSHQRWFALKNVDELVLPAVTVEQSRFSPGGYRRKVHTKVLQSEQVTQRSLLTSLHTAEEWLRIARLLRPERCGAGNNCPQSIGRLGSHGWALFAFYK
jgi:hypothetical protein